MDNKLLNLQTDLNIVIYYYRKKIFTQNWSRSILLMYITWTHANLNNWYDSDKANNLKMWHFLLSLSKNAYFKPTINAIICS